MNDNENPLLNPKFDITCLGGGYKKLSNKEYSLATICTQGGWFVSGGRGLIMLEGKTFSKKGNLSLSWSLKAKPKTKSTQIRQER